MSAIFEELIWSVGGMSFRVLGTFLKSSIGVIYYIGGREKYMKTII